MISVLTQADIPAASRLSSGFGWPHRSEDWCGFLAIGHGVAWREDGALGGTAMWFALDAAHAAIGLVMVAPGMQGRGIGRRLMQAAMAQAGDRNLLLHATAEGAALYASLGFVACGTVQQWQAATPTMLPAGSARLANAADSDAILALDAAATGLSRAAVLRALMAGNPAAVIGPDASPTGYALSRPFGRGQLVGPIVAQSAEDARALASVLQRPGFLRLDIPAGTGSLAANLAACGLASVGDVQVMVRGTWPAPAGSMPAGPALRYALASQALG